MYCRYALEVLAGMKNFSFADFFAINRDNGSLLGEEAMRKKLRNLQKNGEVIRVGRNTYCVPERKVHHYWHKYSEEACRVAQIVHETYPVVDFTLFELIQLNEFVNHQLAHNALFLSVEEEIIDFVFQTMKEYFPGKVLLDPTPEFYHQYWYDGMIVIGKLVTEAPKGREERWHTCLEKLLVDLVTDPLMVESVSESEYPTIFEGAFEKYVIDESCLFRYARRRRSEASLRALIRKKTNITLRTE